MRARSRGGQREIGGQNDKQQRKRRDPNVAVYEYVYQRIKRVASSKQKAINEYVSEELDAIVRREQLLEKVKPFLSIESVGGNTVCIRDFRAIDYVACIRVRYINGKDDHVTFHCEKDDSWDCVHVAYALGLPELGKLDAKLVGLWK